jgi:hypothetical protein
VAAQGGQKEGLKPPPNATTKRHTRSVFRTVHFAVACRQICPFQHTECDSRKSTSTVALLYVGPDARASVALGHRTKKNNFHAILLQFKGRQFLWRECADSEPCNSRMPAARVGQGSTPNQKDGCRKRHVGDEASDDMDPLPARGITQRRAEKTKPQGRACRGKNCTLAGECCSESSRRRPPVFALARKTDGRSHQSKQVSLLEEGR